MQTILAHSPQSSQRFPNTAETTLYKKITCAMFTHSPQTTLHRKIIQNFVWIYLGQYCIRKLPVECCSWLGDNSYEENNLCHVVSTVLGQHCIGILSSQCCLNKSIRKILVQYWPRAHIYIFAGKSAVSNVWWPIF